MPENPDAQIREALEQIDAMGPAHDIPTAPQMWSRLQFRLAYTARKKRARADTDALLIAAFVLGFVMWMTWSSWQSASLIVVLTAAAAVGAVFCLGFRRTFRS
jgi:hypothetical protein